MKIKRCSICNGQISIYLKPDIISIGCSTCNVWIHDDSPTRSLDSIVKNWKRKNK